MNEPAKLMLEAVLILGLGLAGFMCLSVYNMKVIEQQKDLIHKMQSVPACMGR